MELDYTKSICQKEPFDFHDGQVAYSVSQLVSLAEFKPDFAKWCLVNTHFENWLTYAGREHYAKFAKTACELVDVSDKYRLDHFLDLCRASPLLVQPSEKLAMGEIADHLKKLHISHARLGLVGILFSLLAAWVAYEESILHERQTTIEADQKQFNIFDRTLQGTFGINAVWLNVLDADTRFRFARVCAVLKQNHTDTLCSNLTLESNILYFNSTNLSNDTNLTTLIGPDLCAAYGSSNSYKIQLEISAYRSALFRVLNLFDSVAIVREIARDNNNTNLFDIIQMQFWHNITNRMQELNPYVQIYNETVYHTNNAEHGGWIHLACEQEYDRTNLLENENRLTPASK